MKVREIISGFEKVRDMRMGKEVPQSEQIYYELMIQYYRKVEKAKEEGKILAWHTIFVPTEIFFALDIIPFHLDMHTLFSILLQGNVWDSLEGAAKIGIPGEICSAQRMLIGDVVNGILPVPDLIVHTSQTCDSNVKVCEYLSYLCHCPSFFLDRPYRYTERAVKHYEGQLKKLAEFLEEISKRKLSIEKLQQCVALSEEADKLNRELYQLRKAIPAPMLNSAYFRHAEVFFLYSGTKEAVEYFQHVRDEIKELVNGGKGAIEEERYRILFLYVPPLFAMDIMYWMEEVPGAMIVMDFLCSFWQNEEMEPSKPFESLARRSFYLPGTRQLYGPIEAAVEDALINAENFPADGAIFFSHFGCKQAAGVIRALKDALKEKFNIPTLVLDCDLYDPSVVSKEELRIKLEEFFKMLESKKARKVFIL